MTPEEIDSLIRKFRAEGCDSVVMYNFAVAIEAATIERCCSAIRAEDDRASAEDYMLDSDDCIEVLRALAEKEGS